MVIDDIDIRPVRQLRDFLAAEEDRWRPRAQFKRTVVFEKARTDILDGAGWVGQPYCSRKVLEPRDHLALWRTRLRIRSRLRRLVAPRPR
jgi:hypothetical protein